MAETLKRFVVFGWDEYYPGGPLEDFIGSFDTLNEAKGAIEHAEYRQDYHVILDLVERRWLNDDE